jgi:hypothetical protein
MPAMDELKESNILDIYPYFHIGLRGKGPSALAYAIDNKYINIMVGFGAKFAWNS